MASASFELAAPGRVVFGAGVAAQANAAVSALGAKRALVVSGKSTERSSDLRKRLPIASVVYSIPGEPTMAMVDEGRALARDEGCDVVIALGGGSAIDAGKAIAAMAGNDGELADYMEVVGKGRALPKSGLPCIAIPTTAGTGAEVTKNSVLTSPEAKVKASLRSPHLLPVVALIDPDLLDGTPPAITAVTGLDALSHLVESFVSLRANPFTMALGREGMIRVARSLRPAYEHGLTPERREDLAMASLFGGMCLANSGLGAVHGFAAPLGGMWKAPHGAVCAALLPGVMRANVKALSERDAASPALSRYRELDALLGQGRDASAWVGELTRALGIAGLTSVGMTDAEVPLLVEKAKVASSMRGNPIVLTDGELVAIAREAMTAA
jgi:alcohol dehydrogenase class IV